jgi:hypothetical protein
VIDYSGWPLYTRASLPDEDAYKVCDAIAAREGQIAWEDAKDWSPFLEWASWDGKRKRLPWTFRCTRELRNGIASTASR